MANTLDLDLFSKAWSRALNYEFERKGINVEVTVTYKKKEDENNDRLNQNQ